MYATLTLTFISFFIEPIQAASHENAPNVRSRYHTKFYSIYTKIIPNSIGMTPTFKKIENKIKHFPKKIGKKKIKNAT